MHHSEKFPLTASLHPHDNHPRHYCAQARDEATEGQEGEVTFPKSTASNWQSQDSNSRSLALESMFSILKCFSRKIYRTTQNAVVTGLFIAAELEEKQGKWQENKMKSCLNQSKKEVPLPKLNQRKTGKGHIQPNLLNLLHLHLQAQTREAKFREAA